MRKCLVLVTCACLLLSVLGVVRCFAVSSESQVNLLQVTTQKCWDSCPTWYKDGKHVLIASDRLGDSAIWKVPIDGGAVIQVTAGAKDIYDLWPDINPKTGAIVFSSNRAGKTSQIFMVIPGKTGLTQITRVPNDATCPRWSPDGKMIAFCCPDKEGTSYIWIVNSDGSTLRQIVEGYQPCWSPDGRRVAFAKQTTIGKVKNWDIYTIGVDGTAMAQVTSDESHEFQPDWSADGMWLAYVSVKEKTISPKSLRDILKEMRSKRNYEIWIKNVGDPSPSSIQITSSTGTDISPRWSPDGKRIIFASDRSGSLDIWCTSGSLPTSAPVK